MEPFWGYLLGVKELLLEKLLKFKKKKKRKRLGRCKARQL